MSALEKVLRLAGEPELAPGPEQLIRAACESLDELALLLASDDEDEDDDGEGDDSDDDQDEDDDNPKGKKKKGKKKPPPWAKKKVAATALLLGAMVELAGLQGSETLSLSVLTAEGRRKAAKAGYTIAGSEDYPIPDAVHLAAAVARYKQGKFAGHPAGTVRAHILKHAKRLGKEVELARVPEYSVVLQLAARNSAPVTAMHHAPYSGAHSHGHYHQVAVDHEHTHNGDNDHSRHDGAARMGEMY